MIDMFDALCMYIRTDMIDKNYVIHVLSKLFSNKNMINTIMEKYDLTNILYNLLGKIPTIDIFKMIYGIECKEFDVFKCVAMYISEKEYINNIFMDVIVTIDGPITINTILYELLIHQSKNIDTIDNFFDHLMFFMNVDNSIETCYLNNSFITYLQMIRDKLPIDQHYKLVNSMILKCNNVNQVDHEGNTLMHHLVSYMLPFPLQWLYSSLKKIFNRGGLVDICNTSELETPLHIYLYIHGSDEVDQYFYKTAEMMLKHCNDVNVQDIYGFSYLKTFFGTKNISLDKLCKIDDDVSDIYKINVAKLFINNNADINSKDKSNGNGLLHILCDANYFFVNQKNKIIMIRYLLDKNINVNIINYDDSTCLHTLCAFGLYDEEDNETGIHINHLQHLKYLMNTTKVLIAFDVDINYRDCSDETCLTLLLRSITRLYSEHINNINKQSGDNDYHNKRLSNKMYDFIDYLYDNALIEIDDDKHYENHYEYGFKNNIFAYLLNNGLNINTKNMEEKNLLHEILSMEIDMTITQFVIFVLIDKGINVYGLDRYGRKPSYYLMNNHFYTKTDQLLINNLIETYGKCLASMSLPMTLSSNTITSST
jgi:hypothetical protein